MHSTKTEILFLLKRADGATVDELSSSLGLASMTVRQHLTALERDALVQALEVRRRTGRPAFSYRLTEAGHRHVAEGHDRLVALLVDEAGRIDPADLASTGEDGRRRLLFRRAAIALAGRHRGDIHALEGEERIARIAAILRSFGGFADWHARDGEIELRDFSCVFRATVGDDGACDWHEPFLAAALGAPVRATAHNGDGARCCSYVISPRTSEPAPDRGQPA